MEATYQLPSDEGLQRALELVLRWPGPLRGESKLAWQFLVCRAGVLGEEVRVHPAELGAAQGHDARAGFRALNALVAERLLHKLGVDRGFWLVRLRHPAHVVRERLADRSFSVNPQLLLPFMEIEAGAGGNGESSGVAAAGMSPLRTEVSASPQVLLAPGGRRGPNLDQSNADAAGFNADAAQQPHSSKVTSDFKLKSFPASNLSGNFTSEAPEKFAPRGSTADAAPQPQWRNSASEATGPRPIGEILEQRAQLRAARGQQVAACMRWLEGRLACPKTNHTALRNTAQALVDGRLGRTEIEELLGYVDRQHQAGTLKAPTKSGAFFKKVSNILARDRVRQAAP